MAVATKTPSLVYCGFCVGECLSIPRAKGLRVHILLPLRYIHILSKIPFCCRRHHISSRNPPPFLPPGFNLRDCSSPSSSLLPSILFHRSCHAQFHKFLRGLGKGRKKLRRSKKNNCTLVFSRAFLHGIKMRSCSV